MFKRMADSPQNALHPALLELNRLAQGAGASRSRTSPSKPCIPTKVLPRQVGLQPGG